MEYAVYTCRLDNDQSAELNERGDWGGRFAHYASNTLEPTNNTVVGCAAHNFFEKTRIVFADDMEAIFAQLNGMERGVEVIDLGSQFAKSLSVGDVLIDAEGAGFVVARFGFDELESGVTFLVKEFAEMEA